MSNIEIRENIVSINYMHKAVMALDNEYAEELWFTTYPDGADLDDIREMAKDEQQMEWLRGTYQEIMNIFS